jgi:hypothetical protein
MAAIYRHTQFGGWTLGVVAVAMATAVWAGLWGTSPLPPVLLVLGGCLLALFASLTVVVGDQVLEVSFGPGVIRRRIPLSSIREVRVVHSPWYYGWGIRLTPGGWLWNASGSRGVELHFDNGRRFRIGTDEPDRLANVLIARTRAS